MNVTEAFASFATGLDQTSVPESAARWVGLAFADYIGCALAGASSDAGKIVKGRLDHSSSPPEMALTLGVTGHVLDYDDCGGFGHPSAVLVPVVLSLATMRDVSGDDALTAYVAGFEVGTKIGDRGHYRDGKYIDYSNHRRGFHPTSVYGALGATATAARLLRLSAVQTQHAFGIAASQSSGLLQNFGTMTKSLHAGLAARAGVFSALLAGDGFTADDDILASPIGFWRAYNPPLADNATRQRDIAESLGEPFELDRGLIFKRIPACLSSHRAVRGLLELMSSESLSVGDIVEIGVDLRETPLIRRTPATGLEGKFSMAFTVALAALTGRYPTVADFSDEMVVDAEVRGMMAKVKDVPSVVAEQDLERVLVRTSDGRELVTSVEFAPGDPREELDPAPLVRAKLHEGMATARASGADEMFDALLNVGSVPNIGELMRPLPL